MSEKSGGRKSGGQTLGETTISDAVVAKISGVAAGEIENIRMGGATSQAAGSLISSIVGGGSGRTQGVSVEVGQKEAAVDLTLSTEYGKPVPQLVRAVRENVVARVENLTGLTVTEVNIVVTDVYFPDEERS